MPWDHPYFSGAVRAERWAFCIFPVLSSVFSSALWFGLTKLDWKAAFVCNSMIINGLNGYTAINLSKCYGMADQINHFLLTVFTIAFIFKQLQQRQSLGARTQDKIKTP